MTELTGVILAGGEARRMGGRDKGLVQLQGQPLVAHVRDHLAPQVDRIVVVANRNQAFYRAFGEIIGDRRPGFQGPLAGIEAALWHVQEGLVLVVTCDVPDLPSDLAGRLHDAMERSGADVVSLALQRGAQPLPCLVRVGVRDRLTRALDAGTRAVQAWQQTVPHATVDFSDRERQFLNVNSLRELHILESQTEQGDGRD